MSKETVDSSEQDVNNEGEEVEEVTETEGEVEQEEVVDEDETDGEESKHEKSVPYSRFKEVIDSKNTLQGMVQTLTTIVSSNQGKTPQDESFKWPDNVDPETQKAVEQFYHKKSSKDRASIEDVLGGILDKLDEVKATSSNPEIKKHLNLIDQVRREYSQGGAYLTREQAFKILVSEGKIKPAGKKITVKRTEVKVTKDKPSGSGKPSGKETNKDPKIMSTKELDEWMGDKTF